MIKIVRVCDNPNCKAEFSQIVEPGTVVVTYPVAFTCNDCMMTRTRKLCIGDGIKNE